MAEDGRFMDGDSPGIRRVCVAVDIERHGAVELDSLQRRLSAAVADTCGSSDLERLLLHVQGGGAGEIVILPVGLDEPRAVALLVNGFFQAVGRINQASRDRARVRLRMAVHEGITTLRSGVFVGRAVATTYRLLGVPQLRAALASHPHANLAVIFSDRIFEDLGSFDHWLPTDKFRRVEIDGREGGWILVPERVY
jgi:hypothetical protein